MDECFKGTYILSWHAPPEDTYLDLLDKTRCGVLAVPTPVRRWQREDYRGGFPGRINILHPEAIPLRLTPPPRHHHKDLVPLASLPLL